MEAENLKEGVIDSSENSAYLHVMVSPTNHESIQAKGAEQIEQVTRQECCDVLNPRRILWEPSTEQIKSANLTEFMQEVTRKFSIEFPTYDAFYEWSVECPEDFWRTFLHFSNIIYEGDDTTVLTYVPTPTQFSDCAPLPNPLPRGEGSKRMIDARWFPDVRLNFAENLLRHAEETPEKEAIAFFGEDHTETHLAYGELLREVKRFSRILDACDVQCGDRVAALMPNIPETVSAMLATTARGAIWSSVSPVFGSDTIVDRFEKLEPKVLLVVDRHIFRGKTHQDLEKVREVRERIPSIEHVVIVPSSTLEDSPDTSEIRGEILSTDVRFDGGDDVPLTYERFPFDHPAYVLFSSGTQGKSKCIVHGAGGTLLNLTKEHLLHTDLKKDDTIFYFTTTNWMMWNWLTNALGTGSKIILYEGDPLLREGEILFDIAEKERITIFGTNAKFLSELEKDGRDPCKTHDLSSVRTILSTGSTLYAPQFDYVYKHVHPEAQLASISGGTDIVGGFAVGNPVTPVHREELQTRSLGYKVEIFDEEGKPLPPGENGELVCTAPFPSQPMKFWNDPGDELYLKAYFEKYGPAVWHHGDYAERTESGGMVIHGRSDDTLKPGGVRIGPAEIYAQVEKIPEVMESIAVGYKTKEGERIILFVVLREGEELTEELKNHIRLQIRSGASPYHVPSSVHAVPELPRTRNGKVSGSAVRAAIHGKAVQNTDALANPESLGYFKLPSPGGGGDYFIAT